MGLSNCSEEDGVSHGSILILVVDLPPQDVVVSLALNHLLKDGHILLRGFVSAGALNTLQSLLSHLLQRSIVAIGLAFRDQDFGYFIELLEVV